MSLSKPFPLQKLPRLAFEHVLLQMYPLDLFELSNIPSKNLLNQMKACSLASHCDIDLNNKEACLSITMRTGLTLNWRVFHYDSSRLDLVANFNLHLYPERFLEGNLKVVMIGEGLMLKNSKCTSTDTIYSEAHLIDSQDHSEQLLFSQLLSKFPCPIKSLQVFVNPQNCFIPKYIFNWNTVQKCETLRYVCCDRDLFLDGLEGLEVTKKVWIDNTVLTFFDPPAISLRNKQMRDYRELYLVNFQNYSNNDLRESHNEHLVLEFCDLTVEDLIEYLKSWQGGKHFQLKTFTFSNSLFKADLSVIPNGLDLEGSMPRSTPDFVRCYDVFLDPTIRSGLNYQTVLLKNCHNQFATLVVRSDKLYFAVWNHFPSVEEIPKGHRMCRVNYDSCNCKTYPIHVLIPMLPEVFKNDEDARLDLEGFLSNRNHYRLKTRT